MARPFQKPYVFFIERKESLTPIPPEVLLHFPLGTPAHAGRLGFALGAPRRLRRHARGIRGRGVRALGRVLGTWAKLGYGVLWCFDILFVLVFECFACK